MISMNEPSWQAMRTIFTPKILNRPVCKWAICNAVTMANRFVAVTVSISTKPDVAIPYWRFWHILPIQGPIPIYVMSSVAALFPQCSFVDMEEVPMPGNKCWSIMSCFDLSVCTSGRMGKIFLGRHTKVSHAAMNPGKVFVQRMIETYPWRLLP